MLLEPEQSVSVRVALRVRPATVPNQLPATPSGGRPIQRTALQIVPDEPQVIIGKEESSQKSFTFDYVFGQNSTQDEIYTELAAPLVTQFLEGFNATILAYGQTFSGKTYTMGSCISEETTVDDLGIIPRVFQHIFSNLPKEIGVENILKVSFLEIYQEQIRDLLMPQSSNREISVRENKGTIVLTGVHEEVVNSIEDMKKCLLAGGITRTTGDTLMHLHSSRSHAIFTITLEQADTRSPFAEFGTIPVIIRRSKLHLVDLAGSERLKRTGAEGLRLKESVKINSGLLALGNVISILGEDKNDESSSNKTHVPYRDSKLTRLLQDSLGGNSQTLMLACVSPLYDDVDETVNTMKYAYRARKIQNKPIINDQLAMERTTMQQKIDQLEGKLKGLEEHGTGPVPFVPDMIDFDNEMWMQYFMEQLKNRTIRGTSNPPSLKIDAVKALEAANKENELLKEKILLLESKETMLKENQELEEIELLQKQEEIDDSNSTLSTLLYFCSKVIKGEIVGNSDIEAIKEILLQHFSPEDLEPVSSPSIPQGSLATLALPKIQNSSNRVPTSNSIARSHRRKRISSEDHGNANEEVHLKPLEMELRESRKYLAQMEDELTRTKIRLQQTEAVSEQSSKEIYKLNETLRSKGSVALDSSEGIISFKVFADVEVQTLPVILAEDHEIKDSENEFPIYTSQETNVEKLAEELSLATKVKVDLLKELSKVNKEAEKVRHLHADQVLKLERELESLQREMNKVIEEHHERDSLRDRAKDDFERKIKLQESTILKYKQKQKELEKTLKDKGSGDRRLQESQLEMEKLNTQISTLRKKAKDDHERFLELESRKSKELSVLNKQVEEESKKARQNEAKAEMTRKKLDRKSEEISALHKKLKENSMLTGGSTQNIKVGRGMSIAGSIADESNVEYHADTESNSPHKHLNDTSFELKTSELHSQILPHESIDSNQEYIAGIWMEMAEKFATNEKISLLIEQARTANLPQFRQLLIQCLSELATMQTLLVDLQKRASDAVMFRDQLVSLEKKMQKIIRAYEKKVVALQKEIQVYKENTVTTLHPQEEIPNVDPIELPKIPTHQQDEKDVFYYRNVNKELKSKLREVVAVNHRLAKTLKEQTSGGDPSYPVAV